MKKISLGVLGLFITFFSFAQRTHTEFGLKGGVNIANLNDNEVSTIDSRIGFFAGGFAHIHLQPQLALQPEVVYSAQGAKYANGTANFDYINVPVVLQYMFARGFRLETGPQLGFVASAKYDENNGPQTDIKSSIKSTDFSWAFGVGYVTRSGFGLDARYNLGVSNINTANANTLKNRVWQLGIFYQFRNYNH